MKRMDTYLPRLVDGLLGEWMGELPAVMLVGPRACGKTTTAARQARTVIRLDGDDAAAFQAGADAALRDRDEPVLLDEWQLVPEVLTAVKRAVDSERRPGRYLLTGSARGERADRFWPGTGRVVMMHMYPMTLAEQLGRDTVPFVDRIAGGHDLASAPAPVLDLRDYLGLALRGGFPEPCLQLGDRAARAWLESYAEQVALRDVRAYGERPDASRLRRYLEACAACSATVTQHKTLYDAAGISRNTALAYDALLEDLVVSHRVEAWSSNRLKRLSRTPKRYIIDSGLLAGILRVGIDDVLASGRLIGSMLDTFVTAQLRAESAVAATRYRLFHLREQDGRREVDLVVEFGGGRIAGIEIKSASAVGQTDARHLAWLRDQMGEQFVAGVVLHTGRDVFGLGDRITAAPISTLWTSA